MTDNDCLDCIYHTKKGCSDGVIKCEYPLPSVLTISVCMFSNPIMGVDCPLLKTKTDIAKQAILNTEADIG